MKIRNGFVSNSSSSSFVVRVQEFFKPNQRFITLRQESLLEKYGFKKVKCSCADQVVCELYHDLKPKLKRDQGKAITQLNKVLNKSEKKAINEEKDYYNYGYDVSCNQDEPMYFLIKNDIPFEASIHYNHSLVIYAKGARYFIEVQNYGEQVKMAKDDKNYKDVFKDMEYWEKEPIRKVNVKTWLKQQEKWQKEWKETEKKEFEKHENT